LFFLTRSCFLVCDPLPPPSGNVRELDPTSNFRDEISSAQPGQTFLLLDGIYNVTTTIGVQAAGVTIRSKSGNRNAVILDANFNQNSATEILWITASNVTVADLTIRRAWTHPIHVVGGSNSDTVNTLIYNVVIEDPAEQAIKVNPLNGRFVDYGTIACSWIELTSVGRSQVRNNCYTGGIDIHAAMGWHIYNNVISGFWCSSGLSEHGIHLWRECYGTVVENNILLNNARGIGFGLGQSLSLTRTYPTSPCSGTNGYVGHFGGIIRNNFIAAWDSELFNSDSGVDVGIGLEQSCTTKVYHNTVAFTQRPASSAIEWRFTNSIGIQIVNNLVSHNLLPRDGGSATLTTNVESAPLNIFVSPTTGDLHLLSNATIAIKQGTALPSGECDYDIDNDLRVSPPDIGADEFVVPSPGSPSPPPTTLPPPSSSPSSSSTSSPLSSLLPTSPPSMPSPPPSMPSPPSIGPSPRVSSYVQRMPMITITIVCLSLFLL
jgi:hypothetical protein